MFNVISKANWMRKLRNKKFRFGKFACLAINSAPRGDSRRWRWDDCWRSRRNINLTRWQRSRVIFEKLLSELFTWSEDNEAINFNARKSLSSSHQHPPQRRQRSLRSNCSKFAKRSHVCSCCCCAYKMQTQHEIKKQKYYRPHLKTSHKRNFRKATLKSRCLGTENVKKKN